MPASSKDFHVIQATMECGFTLKGVCDMATYRRNKISTGIDDWKTFAKNNPAITPNVLNIKEMETCNAYISKIKSDCKK